ncbi:T9SS type A sorting domain-containing protein [Xanthomarina sp.]|uniref:T9SS type A sorting domain-containing protein n=1 Tax=Xanthomarina sp. TaxID=1931211 RepID=UPI002BC73EC4|nr:T9SS type A sorting domain-containing protein [Xanthomarina sp.]HLV39083.1 T9SS type A sorting domain-containing protein [Xanthomarina sp.]
MKLILLFIFFPCLIFSQTQIGQDINGVGAEDQAGWGLSLSADGTIVAVGADLYDVNGVDSGHVRVFKNINNVWTQIGDDIEGEAAGDNFGFSLSLSADGTIIAIGAYLKNNYTGQVRVFENINNVWTQIGDDINGDNTDDNFAASLDLSADGSTIVIGAYGYDESEYGQAKVFENINNVWTQKGQTLIGDGDYSIFGFTTSISSDGNIITISAPNSGGSNPQIGNVRIYEYLNNSWNQLGNTINATNLSDFFGRGLVLSSDGNIIAVGATKNDDNGSNSGQVKVFENINNTWTQIGQDLNGEVVEYNFGYSLSLSSDGSILGVGSPNTDVNGISSGQAKVYKNINNTWTQIGNNIDGEITDKLGGSVSLSSDGSIIAISSPWNATNGTQSGQVRIYDLSLVLSSDNFVLSQFSLYPNPAKNQVTIKLQEGLELKNVNIYNTLGQFISTSNEKVINTSHLSTGLYLLQIETNQGKATKQLVIK